MPDFKKINLECIELKNKLEDQFIEEKNRIVKKVFLRELNKDLSLEMSSDGICRYWDLTNDYYIGFENKNVSISDFYPLFKKQIQFLEKAIKKEIEFLNIKLENLEKYLDYKKKEERLFWTDSKFDFTVVNSLWEDVTDKKENIDETEYIIKFLINYLEKKEIHNLKKLKFHKNYEEKIWDSFFDKSRKELVIKDYFVSECEIIDYEWIIFRELFDIKYYFENRKKFENDFFKHYLKKNKYINIVGIYVQTIKYLEERLKFEKKYLKESEKTKEKDDFRNEEIEEIKKDIKLIKELSEDFYLWEENFYNCLLKETFNLEHLEKLLLEAIIQKYNLSEKEIDILNSLGISTNITFWNYK